MEAADAGSASERRGWVLGTWAALLGLNGVGSMFAPYLVLHQPIALVLMSPLYRHMVLIAPGLDPVSFVVLCALRRQLGALVHYQLGYHYGERATRWAEQRVAWAGRALGWLERLFRRFGPLLLLWPNPALWLMAGTTRLPPRTFTLLTFLGITLNTLALWFLGSLASVWIAGLLAWLARYMWQATLACVLVLGAAQLLRFRRANRRPTRGV